MFGKLAEYDQAVETWSEYVERVNCFFDANDVKDEKKASIFLTIVGPAVYKLLRSLVAPATVKEKTFTQIIDVLNTHYSPAPSEIVERFRFNSRVRQAGESVATFVSELRRLSEFCNFGDTLDTMIRDRIVCGIQNPEIQRRLLSEKDLKLQSAIDIAVSMETAVKNSLDLQGAASLAPTAAVHKAFHQQKRSGAPKSVFKECIRCGSSDHMPKACPHKDKKCYLCNTVGHLAKKCLKKSSKRTQGPCHRVQAVSSTESNHNLSEKLVCSSEVQVRDQGRLVSHQQDKLNEYEVFHNATSIPVPKPHPCVFTINHDEINMEFDTGCAVSLINQHTYKKLGAPALLPADTALSTFTGQSISVLGTISSNVGYKSQILKLPLLVVEGEGPNLCGRNWIELFNILPVSSCLSVSHENSIESLLNNHSDVFSSELGKFKDYQINLIVKPDVQPSFYKARTLPFAVRDKVKDELQRLQDVGIIKPVRYSQGAAPIVPVLKSDKTSIRICGDFKLTANIAIDPDQYPLPKADDIVASLAGGIQFSKLDLKDAYNQLELDEASRKFTVINTHLGLFEYVRLPFGVSSAPAIFQRVMETLLKGIPGTAVYLDDILVTGCTTETHLSSLKEVLTCLKDSGLKVKRDKCEFLCDSLTFLGHTIDSNGIRPVDDKVRAIRNAPTPTNVGELRSFLGLVTFYSKFLPNMSTKLAPLYNLLQKSVPWHWSQAETEAFQNIKDTIICDTGLLVHYDPSKELVLACDASPYGVGAVLSHTINGEDRPIAFASRTLTPVEKNYAHIEKEALALVFGVTRFREYLLCRPFVLCTDHRPLVTLFSEKKPVPPMANSRIQRWALTLYAYTYTVRYRPGLQNDNADACSRLTLQTGFKDPPLPVELVLQLERVDLGPVSVDDIRQATLSDATLGQVSKLILEGWPENPDQDKNLSPYFKKRFELSVEGGVVLWGNRIVIPNVLRSKILQELQSTHQGVTGMKSIARSLLWWPNLDLDIDDSQNLQ
ncbi:hypothetical protein JTE90_020770 [Oedothorax gibbosus]|uniref:RNA-directed DNA polymerase n=1 Tax=Oedothorax gibbosus TaxID=931172 RepID=A0AAV6TRU4_9ARAC|nr:hypothetical protein JTE90_020770 [Oedothorax gibbosus]